MTQHLSNDAWRTLFEHRLERMEEAVVAMSANLAAITRLQVESEARNKSIEDLQGALKSVRDDIKAIQAEMPSLKATRNGAAEILKWIGAGLIGAVLLVIGIKK